MFQYLWKFFSFCPCCWAYCSVGDWTRKTSCAVTFWVLIAKTSTKLAVEFLLFLFSQSKPWYSLRCLNNFLGKMKRVKTKVVYLHAFYWSKSQKHHGALWTLSVLTQDKKETETDKAQWQDQLSTALKMRCCREAEWAPTAHSILSSISSQLYHTGL